MPSAPSTSSYKTALSHPKTKSQSPSHGQSSAVKRSAIRAASEASETSPLLGHNGNQALTDNGTLNVVKPDPIPRDAKHINANGEIHDEEAILENGEGLVNGVTGVNGVVEPPQEPVQGMPDVMKRMHVLLPALGIGIFLGAADQTIIVSTYAKIGSELHALNSTSWIATAYFLTLTTFQPLYGKFSDIFGRKPALLIAYTIFGLGCLFCGLARTMPELIAARAFAGIGGGGMNVITSVLMSDVIPLRRRGTWQGYVNIIYSAGAAAGAPLGGLLADNIGWRWAFLAQAPMCALAFIAVYFILHLPPVSHDHWIKRTTQIDFPGAFLLITATSALLVGLDMGGNHSWNSPLTIGLLASTLPLYLIFMYVEHIAKHPFAPSHVIFDRKLVSPFLSNFFAMGSYIALIFYVPLYFQAVEGLSSTQAGVRLIPAIAASVTGSVGGGMIMQKTGKYYWLTLVAYCLMFIGQSGTLLFSGVIANSQVGIMLSLTVAALGGGTGVTTTLIALISNCDPADQAIVTACSYLFRSLGSAVGVSLAATVMQARLRQQLAMRLGAGPEVDTIVEGVKQSLTYLDKLTPEVRALVVKCYEKSVGAAFGFSCVLVLGAVISTCFMKEKRLT